MTSILKTITSNGGTVLCARNDGEYTYGLVEFPYLAHRQLSAFAMRRAHKGVDMEMLADTVMGIAFESDRYYL